MMQLSTLVSLSWIAAVSILVTAASVDATTSRSTAASVPTATTSPSITTSTLPVSLTSATTIITEAKDCSNLRNWNIQSDIVIILDTSESFGKQRFEEAKQFFHDLLASLSVLRPNFTQIAVLTFADVAKIVMDFISGNSMSQLPECELFAPGGLWDTMLMWERHNGENLNGE